MTKSSQKLTRFTYSLRQHPAGGQYAQFDMLINSQDHLRLSIFSPWFFSK
ncbi:hypothetical protein QT231_24100 [Halomonas sp. SpR1]|nr:hypothetical protein [Halomonas sp. SpR1]MDQ7735787.1 hypothetical protein [Halomonas sp. SpR1]